PEQYSTGAMATLFQEVSATTGLQGQTINQLAASRQSVEWKLICREPGHVARSKIHARRFASDP
ncbi:MAG: hypothetical protein OEV05_16330, partial [Gammaproteobacteria bacterium]|nr:hypothetical protein [Gammaproteobacteria bacterium]